MSRIRTNLITNRMANGAPTVSHGLVVAGVTTITGSINNLNITGITTISTLDLNGDLDVDGHLNADNVSIAGVVTATTFSGSGASLTNLNGSNIASGTVPVARIGTGTKNTSTFYRGDGTFATVTPPAITAINSASNNRIVTSDGGTTVTAESSFTIDGTSLAIAGAKDIRFTNGGWTGEYAGKIQHHANFLYMQGGSAGFQFRSSGGSDRLIIDSNGHVIPAADNSYNLGSLTQRWANIYTADLKLSNKGSKNDVDNTWGDYTIQEGESDLFLINNRSGKKYKFNLTEVS